MYIHDPISCDIIINTGIKDNQKFNLATSVEVMHAKKSARKHQNPFVIMITDVNVTISIDSYSIRIFKLTNS